MKNKYVKSSYYKFIIFVLSLTIVITMLGCGSGKNAQSRSSVSSLEHSGSVSLSWNAPTKNEDGTTLTDLSGYKILHGTSSHMYENQIDVGNATSVNISNLAPGMYYFALVAYDESGNESAPSSEIWRYIEDS
jgi:hypothetical protein